ncbi:MAG: ABC transporter ATP-binding protein [Verrucomicrobia bacterium]|nr:ABC transporter ATP-binding protein [Verrucomicrobiota bacterium]
MRVEVRNLRRYFGKTKAVDDISFSFESGQVFGFVGPNGAGKTTTMRILATLDEPTSGEAFLNGISVTEDPEKARRLIGFVPDTLPTHSDMTVHEYLDFFARAYGIKGVERREVVEGVEGFTKLTGLREKFLKALSKGMKQRVNLARALVHDPPVLVLDEPAAGLDPRARVELRELLKVLAAQQKAILISSHILTELSEMCHGAVIIEQGKILGSGKLSELHVQASSRRMVRIRPVNRLDELFKELLQMPHVENARIAGEEVEIELDGAEDAAAALLGTVVQKGFQIAEFTHHRDDLEDIFMKVTKGEVQ